MHQFILVVHVIIAVSLIILVLLQHGKGADAGAAMGGGSSQTFFGSQGSSSFLIKVTGVLAALFFATSLSLNYLSSSKTKADSLLSSPGPATISQSQSLPAISTVNKDANQPVTQQPVEKK